MDKQILNFTANEQILVCENPIKISTNKVNYIQAHFDLGTNWSGYDSVRAVWFNDFNCISTVLDSLGNCVVPFEVMKRKGNVKVNLVGSISEDDVLTDRLTSYPVVAVIVDCTAQIVGSNTQPITPSEFEQFAAAVHEDAERAEQGASNAETSAQNASDSATSASQSAVQAGQYSNASRGYSEQAGESATSASGSATSAGASKLDSEAYAVGKRNGADVGSEDVAYHNNAKYYAEQASGSAASAESAKDTAVAKAGEASTSAQTATNKANEASTSETNASAYKLVSEGYAVGKQNGQDVGSGSPYYENNAKYYKEQAEESATTAREAADEAVVIATSSFSSVGSVNFSVLSNGQVRETWTLNE